MACRLFYAKPLSKQPMLVYFTVSNGVRQGGVLSPLLFSVYVDGLFMRLRHSGYGCRIGPHFVGAVGYADDICILSLTPYGLRTMVSICEAYANDYCIEFNGSKCEMLIFSRQPLPENMYPRVFSQQRSCACKRICYSLRPQDSMRCKWETHGQYYRKLL